MSGDRDPAPPYPDIGAARSLAPGVSGPRLDVTGDVWWKNAVVYCLDVKTFLDFDGDGCGDLPGLVQRIDYLSGLGVTCLWLMPFYPSPRRDDGYDITDFYNVDPRLGSLGEMTELLRVARDRGIRVIVDLVANHTSDLHPWFRAARANPESPFRDWYVWRDEPPGEPAQVMLPGEGENSPWTYDEQAGQHYLHHFLRHQPDLNLTNPAVRDEIVKTMGFWLSLGVSGFRMDAVPFLVEDPEGSHELLRAMRAFMTRRYGGGILLGEVNLEPGEQLAYFGSAGDELNVQFAFPLNQAMVLSLAREDAGPIRTALAALPEIPPDAAWATFVRNHDELTLDKLSDAEREEVFARFGPDPEMQIFGRGLRRRLPTMVGGDPRRIRLAYSLMFSLPGTPVLFYGEEIGMGENLDTPGRLAVRPPMQWSDEPHAGFSPPGSREPIRPVVEDPDFGPGAVSVAAQRRDEGSLLNWMERLIRRRRECPEIGWGEMRVLDCDDRVLAHRCDWQSTTLVAVHNLSADRVEIELELEHLDDGDDLLDVLGADGPVPRDGRRLPIALEPYGYRWLRVRRAGQRMLP